MRRSLVTTWAVAALVAAGLAAARDQEAREYPDTHPPAGVVRSQSGSATQFEASVPGELLDWALLERVGKRPEIYLLSTVEDDPQARRALYRVDLVTPGLVPLATDLAPESDRLAARDIDGDGTMELLLGRPGRILVAARLDGPDAPRWSPLAIAPGLDLGSAVTARGGRLAASELVLPNVGVVRHFGLDASARWGEVARWPLVTRAARHLHGLRLTSPQTTLLRLWDGDFLAVGPEAVGTRRLRSLLVPVDGEARDVWSRLPGPENVQSSSFHVLDGRPVLIVTTNTADKLGVLERQELHLFSLYSDRTQAGVGPWLSTRTTSRRWQRVEPHVLDIDGDGDDDLVVAQVDGLGSGKTHLEAFLNSGRRGFEATRRSATIERPAAAWHLGADLTGDGLADLVLMAEGALEVYPALAAGSRRLFDRRPRWAVPGSDIPRVEHSVTLGPGGVAVTEQRPSRIGRPAVHDLDGDGRGELLLAENPQWGFGRLRIVFLP